MRLVVGLLTLLSVVGVAEGQQAMQPNCQYKYRFTNRTGESAETGVIITGGAAAAPWIDNTAQGCVGWQLQYSSEGFSAISLNLQSALRTFAGVLGASTPGTISTFTGTDVLSSLPLTSTSGGQYIGYAFFPYIRVNLATATGTGTVEVVLNGWKSITYAKGMGGAPSGAAGGDLTGTYPNPTVASGLSALKVGTGVVNNTEFSYLDGVTSAIQTQFDAKLPINNPTATGTFTIGATFSGDSANWVYNGTALSTPGNPTLSTAGTAGSTSIGYVVVALNALGHSIGSNETFINTANATLTGSNFVIVQTQAVTGSTSCVVYRNTPGPSPATWGVFAASIACGATLNDTGVAGDLRVPFFSSGSAGMNVAKNQLIQGHGAIGNLAGIDKDSNWQFASYNDTADPYNYKVLSVQETIDPATAAMDTVAGIAGIQLDLQFAPTTAQAFGTNPIHVLPITLTDYAGNTNSAIGQAAGFLFHFYHNSPSVVQSYLGNSTILLNSAGSGEVTDAKTFFGDINNSSVTPIPTATLFHAEHPTGPFGTFYAFHAQNTGAETATNEYGLYIDAFTAGSSASYNIYSAGATSKNRFEGLMIADNLKTTGAATGKKIVCVDTSTGQLYASSSGVACAN